MRTLINKILALLGVAVIVVPSSLQEQFWVLFSADLVGIALITVGVWGLGSRLFPNRRVYVGLRSEVDHFIGLVRKLNQHALVGDTAVVEQIRQEMLAAVDRMTAAAGRADAQPPERSLEFPRSS
ncbi:MAG: hypothetical protein AMS25_09825 [Gemmatimonas sp. SM23_52]|nr:MAG: hypothetical protein AMS25_09825 [Gemmatimonas sp. SM23_52]